MLQQGDNAGASSEVVRLRGEVMALKAEATAKLQGLNETVRRLQEDRDEALEEVRR